MLNFFTSLAVALKPYRKAIIILIAISVFVAIAGFVRSDISPDTLLQLGLSSTLFCAMLLATVDIFYKTPAEATPELRWWARQKRRLSRLIYTLIALLMLVSSLLLLNAIYKLFSV